MSGDTVAAWTFFIILSGTSGIIGFCLGAAVVFLTGVYLTAQENRGKKGLK